MQRQQFSVIQRERNGILNPIAGSKLWSKGDLKGIKLRDRAELFERVFSRDCRWGTEEYFVLMKITVSGWYGKKARPVKLNRYC